MPLIKSASKKAFQKNVETEMKANPGKANRAQNLAIAYSTQRQAKKRKMASGGEIKAASSRPTIDEMEQRSMRMTDHLDPEHDANELSHMAEIDARDEHMSGIDDADDKREMDMVHQQALAEGGEISFHDEHMDNIDDMKRKRSMDMLDAKPMSHMSEKRAATKMVDEDDGDSMETDMMHQELESDSLSKDGVLRYSKGGSVADMIRKKNMYARGGEVDLQDSNGDEHLNEEDQLSFDAARKKTYYDDSQISSQPMDSNEHGDELSDADSHDMVSSIRKRMKSKRS